MTSFTLSRTWSDGEKATLGMMYAADDKGIRQICYTLEDIRNVPKVPGRTRIPEGQYQMKRRTHGRWAQRMQAMGYPGSIEVYPVEGFTDVLIHYGNDDEDTSGCILLGEGCHMHYGNSQQPFLFASKKACDTFYHIYFSKPNDYDWTLWVVNNERRSPPG